MKYRFLTTFLRHVAPAAAFAALLSSQRAFGDISIDSLPATMETGDNGTITVSWDDDEIDNIVWQHASLGTQFRPITISASPAGVVKFQKFDDDGNPVGQELNDISLDAYKTVNNARMLLAEVRARVIAKKPGTVTIHVEVRNSPAANFDEETVVVTASEQFSFQNEAGENITRFVVPEGNATDEVSLFLDFGYELTQTVNFTVTSDDTAGAYLALQDPPIRALHGNRTMQYKFSPLDGGKTVRLTFTGDIAYTTGQSIDIVITNDAPNLSSPLGTEDKPDPTDALKGSTKRFTAFASDVDADANLTYRWYLNNNYLGSAYNTAEIDYQINAEGVMSVEAVDKDGGVSRRGYWQVSLVDASKITINDSAKGLGSIEAVQGAGATAFYNVPGSDVFQDDIPKAHDPENGNYFYQNQDITIRAVPVDSEVTIDGQLVTVPSYGFGWFMQDPSITDALNLNLPTESSSTISVTVPSSGTTIRFLSSNPYLGYYDENTHMPIDLFGDIDQDGLSDRWEAEYLDDGTPSSANVSEGTLPALMDRKGANGASGTSYSGGEIVVGEDTPDNDRLPTKAYEDIENVWKDDPYYVPGATNIVRVYRYPLVDGGKYVNYGTYLGALSDVQWKKYLVYPDAIDEIGAADKPFFDNLTEFRGLPQASSAYTDPANWPSAPNFVRVGYPGLLTKADRAKRGNSPGTDPKVDDTDGDGLGDGWEYYFWTTVLYENKPEFWRAFDPTFASYPEVRPGQTADFRAAGIPLLRRDIEALTNGIAGCVVYSDGSFVRFPDETFNPTVVRSDSHYGYPVDENKGGVGSRLAHSPVCSFAYADEIDDDADGNPDRVETHAAVELTMGTSFKVFTRAGRVDARGRATLWYQPHQGQPDADVAEEPVEIAGAYVDFASGELYLPGYDYYPADVQALIGARDAALKVRYRAVNGLFPKAFILNKFDPMGELAGNFSVNAAEIVRNAGLDPNRWSPDTDLDNDGIPDFDEYFLGTNPLHWDTDNDGIPDGWELIFGLDPHDPSDASANPDGDMMYAVGPYRHVDAFLYDQVENQTYWNGQTSLGFVPGAAIPGPIENNIDFAMPFTSLEEFYVQKWIIGKEGEYPGFTTTIYPSDWQTVNPSGEAIAFRSLDPMDDDTDGDHIPDGWALYAGYTPNSYKDPSSDKFGMDLVEYVWSKLKGGKMPKNKRDDPDGDKLGWLEEFQNWTMMSNRIKQLTSSVESEKATVGRTADWYKPDFGSKPVWTWKTLPTCPWLDDTDGDGIPDGYEYLEEDYANGGVDFNGDRKGKEDMLARFVNLNPCSADTDLDRLPDGWEVVGGLYDSVNAKFKETSDPFGPYGDPDCDGLPNYQEYLTGAVYGWRYDKWYAPDDKTLWLPDPAMTGYAISSAAASDAFVASAFSATEDAFPYGKSVHFRKYQASDFMRPAPSPRFLRDATNAVKRLEARWGWTEKTANGWEATAAGRTASPTLGDLEAAEAGPNGNSVVSLWANWWQRAWAVSQDAKFNASDDTDDISLAERSLVLEFLDAMEHNPPEFSYGCIPADWESKADNGTVRVVRGDVKWAYIPINYYGIAGYAGTMPRAQDTDNDGMDDYWEIYHGLNPTYGGSYAGIVKAGSAPNGDRADMHPWGNGSKNDWIMGFDSAFVRNMTVKNGYLLPFTRVDGAFHLPTLDGSLGPSIASAAHFDYKTRPWLAGDPTADPDQDGLSNQEECYNERMTDVLHHTDPSPYWFTDTSYAESYVNLYYAVDREMGTTRWWWPLPVYEGLGVGPTYLFDFEVNEGFDTDNDNISDRAEISGEGGTGVTDPLDLDGPRARKALYLDGHAAARTRNPYFHDKWTLTSYTVEFWCRPETLPGPGRRATLLQRPVFMPVDDSSSATRYQLRHTFLVQLDELGRIHAQVDNDALETVSSATVVSTGRLAPDIWTHVAVVMDSSADTLSVYIDEKFSGSVGAALKPCTGYLGGAEYLVVTNGSPLSALGVSYTYYDYSPAPIVIGAFDRNPLGIVAGTVETAPWGLPVLAGNSQPDFDPNQYFNGWIDEVRIWDRCRTQDQIVNAMTKRFSKEDIEKINHERFRWEMQGWQPGHVGYNMFNITTGTEIPQKLLYHYSFDNLPDVIEPGVGRDIPERAAGLFSADAAVSPAGWNSDTVSRYRPVPFWTAPEWYPLASTSLAHLVPWWYSAKYRSNVYTDYSYVPFIENTVAHMPQWPALDMRGIIPNFNTNEVEVVLNDGSTATMQSFELTSYRRRASNDWLLDTAIDSDRIVPATLDPSGSPDIALAQVRNTMNPYGEAYGTALAAVYETHPDNFPGELDRYNIYHCVPVLSDMLPLMDAVSDIDVPMWDGRGKGTEVVSIDTDGDGLPDWWEIASGLDPESADGDNGAHADPDGDGLDNIAEYLAGTNPYLYDTDSDGYSDYLSRLDGQSLTWGELYDDGDGMPNDWETKYGLDPEHYDADDDLDVDGWSNWEEYMAGTNPSRADDFPEPGFNVKFYYDGEHQETGELYVNAYSEKRAASVHNGVTSHWGGERDAKYWTRQNEIGKFGSRDSETVDSIGGVFKTAKLKNEDVGSLVTPVVTVKINAAIVTLPGQASNRDDAYCMFKDDEEAKIFLRWKDGVMLAQSGTAAVGSEFKIEYTTGGRAYPVTVKNLQRTDDQLVREHLVSGYNRFFGWLDLPSGDGGAGNGEYDVGEPAGIALYSPTLVSWDAVDAEIPLTDELFGFPRLSWPASTNGLATRYVVKMFARSDTRKSALENGSITDSPGICIEVPRNYIHEGDYIDAGIKGICLQNGMTADSIEWQVTGRGDDWYEDTLITNGTFEISFLDNNGSRREMEAMSPLGAIYGEGALVEFKWKMDWRTEGVFFTVKDSSGKAVSGLDNLYVPFPVGHGSRTGNDYYYTAIPQLENALSPVALPVGAYTYTITENLRTTGVQAKTVSGSFLIQAVPDEITGGATDPESPKGGLFAQYRHSASGSVEYFGKVSGGLATTAVADAAEICAGPTFDGTAWSWSAGTVSGDAQLVEFSSDVAGIVPGAMVVEISYPTTSGEVTERLNDRMTQVATDGALYAESGEKVWSGSIRYPSEGDDTWEIKVVFDSQLAPPPAGTKISVKRKAFRAPLVIQAFKLPDNATTSLSVSGHPFAEIRQQSKGAFVFTGLDSGTYAFRAFIDSNGNGFPDDWETQGLAVKSGTESPVLSREAEKIVIDAEDVIDLLIVLHDRDTDNDLLPDSWEYEMWRDISAHKGFDSADASGVIYYYQEYADGPLDSDPRSPDTDLDGLTDAMELAVTGTSTHLKDTDGDGVGDLEEFLSGSDPNDPADAKPFAMPALEFDEDGAPFVDCPYPALPRGVTLAYVLQRKASLADEGWEDVDEMIVAATPETEVTTAVADGVSLAAMPAGVARMTPADKAETMDWKSGFFRVRVFADYGRMVENEDGTFSFWTWVGSSGAFEEVARGEGLLERDIDGNWSFVDKASNAPGSLVRHPDGTWSFVR